MSAREANGPNSLKFRLYRWLSDAWGNKAGEIASRVKSKVNMRLKLVRCFGRHISKRASFTGDVI